MLGKWDEIDGARERERHRTGGGENSGSGDKQFNVDLVDGSGGDTRVRLPHSLYSRRNACCSVWFRNRLVGDVLDLVLVCLHAPTTISNSHMSRKFVSRTLCHFILLSIVQISHLAPVQVFCDLP